MAPSPSFNPNVYRVHGRHDFNPTSMKNLNAFDQGKEMAAHAQHYQGYPGQGGPSLHQSEDPFPPHPAKDLYNQTAHTPLSQSFKRPLI